MILVQIRLARPARIRIITIRNMDKEDCEINESLPYIVLVDIVPLINCDFNFPAKK